MSVRRRQQAMGVRAVGQLLSKRPDDPVYLGLKFGGWSFDGSQALDDA